MFLEHLQGQWLHHLPGQPISVPDHPFREAVFPNVQPQPSLAQLEVIPSSPITSHMREEADPHLTATFFQVEVEISKVSHEPSLLQTKQSQLTQPLLIRPVLRTPLLNLQFALLRSFLYLSTSFSIWLGQSGTEETFRREFSFSSMENINGFWPEN